MESSNIEAPLFAFLESLGIKTKIYRHKPFFTVEDAKAHRSDMPGGHCKNLFVRDKKKRRALVVVDENRRVDLKLLAGKIGLGRLSFGNADSLQDILGVSPGSVTPFALINAQVDGDADAPIVVALDKHMMTQSPLYYHPLHNEATISIEPTDLVRFIEACGYEPIIVDLDDD